jgi:hypothetical protein
MNARRYSTGPGENTPLVTCLRCGAVLERWSNPAGVYDDSQHPGHDGFHAVIDALIDGEQP